MRSAERSPAHRAARPDAAARQNKNMPRLRADSIFRLSIRRTRRLDGWADGCGGRFCCSFLRTPNASPHRARTAPPRRDRDGVCAREPQHILQRLRRGQATAAGSGEENVEPMCSFAPAQTAFNFVLPSDFSMLSQCH